ncbi:MAG: nuclear transport factor 2 family protein [Acidobacteria bacterium]|nr:nuclear transport factor 2 family protein [Acidobacteriota bacterium]
MTETDARQFAAEWIAAWNAHDLDRILSHYADDVRFVSPFVQRIMGQQDGVVQGIPALRDYFSRGLAAYPDLRFELYTVLAGVNSVTLYYGSVKNLLAAEVMAFDSDGRISSVLAHYASEAP